jgi:hypothetical protein
LGQLNAAVTANIQNDACAPTSYADGLIYLNNLYGNQYQNYNISSSTANGYKAVNDLATVMGTTSPGGTSYGTSGNQTSGNSVSGLAKYISKTGANPAPGVSIVGGQYIVGTGASIPGGPTGPNNNFANVVPTAATIAGWLNKNYAIEILLQFGSYGGVGGTTWTQSKGQHYVDVTSINVANKTLTLLDPWGTSASQESATMNIVGGYMYLTSINYVTGLFGVPGQDNGGTAPAETTGDAGDAMALGNARIVTDLAETAVPEPSTYLGGALLLIPFTVNSVRRLRASRRES